MNQILFGLADHLTLSPFALSPPTGPMPDAKDLFPPLP